MSSGSVVILPDAVPCAFDFFIGGGASAARIRRIALNAVVALMQRLLRRHVYQEAYLRRHSRKGRPGAFTRFCTTRINPSHLEDADQLNDEIESIRAAFVAVENTYHASLCRMVGYLAFTEPVQRSHGTEVTTRLRGLDTRRAGRRPAGDRFPRPSPEQRGAA
jgi:hypothetical protein